ncbi:hypothetical protein P3T36_007841 [Kitasatospora sp. MAP12-15]|uniref:hypothetical protein n=1 Tax=Kitasatospora sp. MAP12-44 TaxID=3035099 RepID=UPI002477003F|nr:hypothetical protein [Kitasatospora sp. MAP12-44]MDH6115505.1 hypothetical protein [Kitasatospora sp. MAP12-44]
MDLDLRRGVLTRHALVVDAQGRRTRLVQRRIASQAQPHLAVLETELLAENWSGPLEVRSALDGTVANTGVARYRGLTSRHLVPAGQGLDEDGTLWLQVATAGSPLHIALAARTRATPHEPHRTSRLRDGWAADSTSSTAPPPRASTSARWPAPSTSCTAATQGWRSARTPSGWTPACPRRSAGSNSTCATGATGASGSPSTGTRSPSACARAASRRSASPSEARRRRSCRAEDGRAYLAETARHRPAVHVQRYAMSRADTALADLAADRVTE